MSRLFTDKSSKYVKLQTLSSVRPHALRACFGEWESGWETLTSVVNTLLGALCRRTHTGFKCRMLLGFEALQGSFDCIKSPVVNIKQKAENFFFLLVEWGLTWPSLPHLRGVNLGAWLLSVSDRWREVKRGHCPCTPHPPHASKNLFFCLLYRLSIALVFFFLTFWFYLLISN